MSGTLTGRGPIVSPRLGEPSGSVCWNCDRRADDVVAVTLRMPTGIDSTLGLCRPCYDSAYVPVAAAAEDAGLAIRHGPTTLALKRAGDRSGRG